VTDITSEEKPYIGERVAINLPGSRYHGDEGRIRYLYGNPDIVAVAFDSALGFVAMNYRYLTSLEESGA
jgi:hypothetical protein